VVNDVETVRAVHGGCHERLTDLTVANREDPSDAFVVGYDKPAAERKRDAERAHGIAYGGRPDRLWEAASTRSTR
jgi:hypothetical protein